LSRSVTLLAIPVGTLSDGEHLVLIASNFGNASHPAWYHNLIAHPQVQVTQGSSSRAYLAQPVEGDERQRLWDLAAAYYPGYDNYQANVSSRTIPVVFLTPIEVV
jgi:deazaflavin-dependent oxidoreductase (nitroreductase family)